MAHGLPAPESSGKGVENAEFLGPTQELASQNFSGEGPRNLQLILMHSSLRPTALQHLFPWSFPSFQSRDHVLLSLATLNILWGSQGRFLLLNVWLLEKAMTAWGAAGAPQD